MVRPNSLKVEELKSALGNLDGSVFCLFGLTNPAPQGPEHDFW